MKKVIKGHGSFTLKSDGPILERSWNSFETSTLTIQNFNLPQISNQSLLENAKPKQKDAGKSSKSSKKRQNSSKSTQASKKPKVEKSPVVESSPNGIPEPQNDTKQEDNDEIQQALKMSKSEFISS